MSKTDCVRDHFVHVRDYSNGSDLPEYGAESADWRGDGFKQSLARHGGEPLYFTDKGRAFTFASEDSARAFAADINYHCRELAASID